MIFKQIVNYISQYKYKTYNHSNTVYFFSIINPTRGGSLQTRSCLTDLVPIFVKSGQFGLIKWHH